MTSLARRSGTELAALIRSKEVSPVEVTQFTLTQIEASQKSLNTFITICAEQALDAARAAEDDVMRSEPLGLLHGVPFSAKDLMMTKGVRTTFGSLALENSIPSEDSVVITRLKRAG